MTKKYLLCFFILLVTTFASNLLSPSSNKVQAKHMHNSGPAAVNNKVEHFVYLPLIVGEGTALLPPSIVAQPLNALVTEPEAATFTVAASSNVPLTYQWRRNGFDITGATSATYILSSTSVADDGAQFDVVVSNPHGSVSSQVATLTVMPAPVPPSIDTQPVSVAVTEPAAVTFSVVASGDAPLSYQWRRNDANINGATSASYTLNTTSVADDGAVFDVVVSNPHGSVTSQPATLTVEAAPVPPQIDTKPADVTVTEPAAAAFSVVASGDAPLSYQWRRNGVNINGATSTTYVLDPTSVADSGATFDVVVNNPHGSITSPAATLTVNSNTPPVAVDDLYSVASGGAISTIAGLDGVLANDSDVDGHTLTATLIEDVLNGTLTLSADGSFVYTHSGNDAISFELSPGAGNSLVEYGIATAIDGDTLVVGSNSQESDFNLAGAVYVFVREGVHWHFQAKLVPLDPVGVHFFGWTVGISGDTIVVGAPGDNDAGTWSGAAYVFVREGTSWSQQAKLAAVDAEAGDEFGVSVAIDGDTLVVGSYLDDDVASDSGAAYVFVRNGDNWSQQAKLTASNPSAAAWFGIAVALDGDIVSVGAIYDDTAGTNAGAAYIFVRNGASWSQQQKLTAGDGAAHNTFGFAVAVQGNTAVIGASGFENTSGYAGAAYVFQRNGATWSQQQKLTAADATTNGFFGFGVSVALDGDAILIGAYGDDEMGVNAGSAYLFVHNGATWVQDDKLYALEPDEDDEYGVWVALDGEHAVIGANSKKFDLVPDRARGSAYVYQIGGTLTDTFTYVANDGVGNSNVATVTITLAPASRPSHVTAYSAWR